METIFDHGATLAELAAIWGEDFADQAEYLEFLEGDQQAEWIDIGRLAKVRQDKTLLNEALKRIESPGRRRDLMFTPCVEAGHRLASEPASHAGRQAA